MSSKPASSSSAIVGLPEQRDSSIVRKPYLTIRPNRGWVSLDLKEMIRYRDLLFAFATRDLKLRYKQTALGIIWVVLQPLLAAGIFSFVFGTVAKLPSDDVPYLVFSYAGLLGWNLFSNVVTKVSGCLVGNANLISKVYFPRLILPLSNVGSVLVDFCIAAVIMIVLMFIYQISPTLNLLLVPLWLALLLCISIAIGLITSALAVPYRDIQYILPVFVQILLYASPVAYSISAVPDHLQWLYMLNPLAPVLECLRASLLGAPLPSSYTLIVPIFVAIVFLLAGLFQFKRMEKSFADQI